MKSHLLALLSLGTLVVAGCSSVPVQVNQGKVQAKTFSFMIPKGETSTNIADPRAELHAQIQDAITRTLAAKGMAKVATGGEVTVGYLIVVGSGATTGAIDDYFGHGSETTELIEKAHTGAAKKRDEAQQRMRSERVYKAGALVVDVLDTQTGTLLFRNFAYRDLLRNPSKAMRVERIQEAIDEAFGTLRVSQPR